VEALAPALGRRAIVFRRDAMWCVDGRTRRCIRGEGWRALRAGPAIEAARPFRSWFRDHAEIEAVVSAHPSRQAADVRFRSPANGQSSPTAWLLWSSSMSAVDDRHRSAPDSEPRGRLLLRRLEPEAAGAPHALFVAVPCSVAPAASLRDLPAAARKESGRHPRAPVVCALQQPASGASALMLPDVNAEVPSSAPTATMPAAAFWRTDSLARFQAASGGISPEQRSRRSRADGPGPAHSACAA